MFRTWASIVSGPHTASRPSSASWLPRLKRNAGEEAGARSSTIRRCRVDCSDHVFSARDFRSVAGGTFQVSQGSPWNRAIAKTERLHGAPPIVRGAADPRRRVGSRALQRRARARATRRDRGRPSVVAGRGEPGAHGACVGRGMQNRSAGERGDGRAARRATEPGGEGVNTRGHRPSTAEGERPKAVGRQSVVAGRGEPGARGACVGRGMQNRSAGERGDGRAARRATEPGGEGVNTGGHRPRLQRRAGSVGRVNPVSAGSPARTGRPLRRVPREIGGRGCGPIHPGAGSRIRQPRV